MDPRTASASAVSQQYTQFRTLASPKKRVFTPFSDTHYCDIKKRRLLHGFEGIQPRKQWGKGDLNRSVEQSSAVSFSPAASPMCTKSASLAYSTPQTNRSHGLEGGLSSEDFAMLEISKRPKFKARPVPRTNYQPSICIRASDKPLTVPIEPNVYNHARSFSCSGKSSAEERQDSGNFRARHMPDFSVVSLPEKKPFLPTKHEEFALRTEERGMEKEISLQHKLNLELQEDQHRRAFKANPLPIFPTPRPIPHNRPPTVLQPFNFHSPPVSSLPYFPPENAFRALQMPDFSRPFQPTLPGQCTQPMDIELHSDIQAKKRSLYDEKVAEDQRRSTFLASIRAQEQAKRESEEIKTLRKQMEFEARPMPAPSNFSIQRSGQVLTVPVAPFLHTAERAALKSFCDRDENFNPNFSQTQSHASTHCTEVSMSICEDEEDEVKME